MIGTFQELLVAEVRKPAPTSWLLGGGPGHGFKHGPGLGERVAGWALGDSEPEPRFTLARFES